MRRQVVLYLVACLYVCQRACIAKPVGDGEADDVDYMEYLIRYNYMKEAKPGDPVSYRHIDEVSKALREFQHMASIPETGVFDDATKAMMKMPRCGNPDKPKDSDHREKRYTKEGSRWKRNNLTYAITGYTNSLSRSSVRREIQRAFDVWSEVTPLRFTRSESRSADIEIYFARGKHCVGRTFDGQDGVLAHAFFPRYGGDIHFDESERWTIRLNSGTNLFQVAAHEIGHSLGLDHSAVKSALMSAYYRGYVPNFKLHSDDIAGIQSLYGQPVTATTKRPTTTAEAKTTTSATTTTEMTTTTTATKTATTTVATATTTAEVTTATTATAMAKTATTTAATPTATTTATTTTTTTTTKPREDDRFNICAEGRFDAIATIDDQQYGFVGDYYVQLTRYGIAFGYPKRITDRWSKLPTPLDAAVQLKEVGYYKYVWTGQKSVLTFIKKPTRALFFKGDKIWSYVGKNLQSGYPKLISEEFRGLPNDIDSAFVWSGNKKLYFTKGSRYYRYTRNNAIDRGYPRSLSAWRGLPSSVDAAFQDENYKVTYFFKGKDYYRFDDRRFAVARVYPHYPRYIDIWWLGC